ncbi:Tol biopolymer transport system component [Rhodanobacter sp. K2T2]|uniref:TolB family protein n=1 Tax=Rhodanobacter sp. K2T2 TaxID=2723085 RepID=UPI0015CC6281|nr:PD40 domain-containing protein [Rhodanobacter sp. K2T2]NYE27381.1 Tol biopolymer transport system component [Rhodanobacter sp. K2T2]
MKVSLWVFISAALLLASLYPSDSQAADKTIRNVTDDPIGTDYGPQFSPDGKFLIFDRQPLTGGISKTNSVPLQGGTPKPLGPGDIPVEQTRTRWSPRGDMIAFTGTESSSKGATWLMDKDGTHIRRAISSQSESTFYPSWFPDNERILEMVADDNTLRTVDIRNGTISRINTTPALMTGMASVSPDGKWIAVAAQPKKTQIYDQTLNQIWIVSVDTGKAHPLIQHTMQGRAPEWSPDGSRIVFESNQGSPRPPFYAAFVSTIDGQHVEQLTPFDRNTQHPVWSSDGKWIAFSARTPKLIGYGPSIAVIEAPYWKP